MKRTTVIAVLTAILATLACSTPAQARTANSQRTPIVFSRDVGLVAGSTSTITVPVQAKLGTTIRLQRKVNGKWENRGKATKVVAGKVLDGQAKLTFKVPAKRGTYTYRVSISKSSTHKARTFDSFSVYVSDHSKHKVYLASIKKLIGAHCSGVPVLIDSPRMKSIPYAAGIVFDGTTIYMKSGLNTINREYIARHECAHVVQHRKYDPGSPATDKRWNSHQKTTEKLFANSRGHRPRELEADCMVAAWNGVKANKKFHAHYLDKCSTKQLAHAKKTLTKAP